jgi:hypothetical protein
MSAPTPAQLAAWTEYIRALAAHAVKESAAAPSAPTDSLPPSGGQARAADQTEDAANRYADYHIRRDKLHRDDGRPEDDRDTGGRRI